MRCSRLMQTWHFVELFAAPCEGRDAQPQALRCFRRLHGVAAVSGSCAAWGWGLAQCTAF